jgi:DNA-binding transcriptional LysR family regulator
LHSPPESDGATPVGRKAHLHASVLRYLAEVARVGSIRRASMTLNVAPSAIDRQVLRIEGDLGIRIFDRMPTGMRLTPAGELLLRHVRSTLRNFDRLLTDIDGLQGIHSGHVNLAAVDSLLVDIVPRALAEVADRYPAVSFSAIAASPAAVLAGIEAGEMELGLTFVVPTGPTLELVASAPAPLGCVMAPSHELAHRTALSFADLIGHAVTVQSESLPAMSSAADELADFRGRAQARFISNSIEFQRHILHTGLAVACLTRLGFQREIASGELVWVPLASPSLQRLEIGLFVPAQRTLSPAATQVVKAVANALQTLRDGH